MKKFFTIIPLQIKDPLQPFCYTAVGNSKLQMQTATRFPIFTAMCGYLEPGEDFCVIYVAVKDDRTKENERLFLEELSRRCEENGYNQPHLHKIAVENDNSVMSQAKLFQQLIDYMEKDDELFACITYGVKPQSMALQMAVQYSYRMMENSSICMIVYGEISRPSRDESTWEGKVYDMTALVQMDEIVHSLAEQKIQNPKYVIDILISL